MTRTFLSFGFADDIAYFAWVGHVRLFFAGVLEMLERI